MPGLNAERARGLALLEGLSIGGIEACSLIDFPGALAAVLFLRGCALDCFYCHNRALRGAGPCLEAEAVVDFLLRRRGRLDGLVFSGGEATDQWQALGPVMAYARTLGYRLKLDSHGLNPRALQALLAGEGAPDYVALDYKAPLADWAWVVGRDEPGAVLADRLRQSVEALQATAAQRQGFAYELRTTLYPGLGAEGLLQMAQALPPQPCWRLQPYRPPACLRSDRVPEQLGSVLEGAKLRAILPELMRHQPGVSAPGLV